MINTKSFLVTFLYCVIMDYSFSLLFVGGRTNLNFLSTFESFLSDGFPVRKQKKPIGSRYLHTLLAEFPVADFSNESSFQGFQPVRM